MKREKSQKNSPSNFGQRPVTQGRGLPMPLPKQQQQQQQQQSFGPLEVVVMDSDG
jgi:hypothetical protein